MALDIVESNQEAGLIASARKQEDAGNWLVQIPISAFPNSLHIGTACFQYSITLVIGVGEY